MSPLADLSAQLHRARHGAAVMRKRARLYAQGGADWLAHDTARRARLMSLRAREYARRLRIVRAIAAREAANA